MKKLLPLCVCVILLFTGCARQNQKTGEPEITQQTSEEVFPEVMVGVWEVVINKRTGNKWGIKFEQDGSIKKVIHVIAGPVNLSEGGAYRSGSDPNIYGVYVMGPCEAKYNHKKDEVEVKIVLDYFEIKLGGGILKGRMETYFVGPVSDDGKTWKVLERSYGDIEGATMPDPNIIDQNPQKLTFIKMDINDARLTGVDFNDIG